MTFVFFFFFKGFRLNASSWPMFLLKTLNGADMAPAKIFHKVQPIQQFLFCSTIQLLDMRIIIHFKFFATQIRKTG